MNQLNNSLHEFVDNGADMELLKSLKVEGASDELVKAMSREGLVQKEVQYKTSSGKMATRKQWVKANESSDSSKGETKETKDDSSSSGFDQLKKDGVYVLKEDADGDIEDALVVHSNGKIYRENGQSNPSPVSEEQAKQMIEKHQSRKKK